MNRLESFKNWIKEQYKITIFEICLTAMILGIALSSKYFDNFIPHVHPFHIVTLIIGIAILRVFTSTILVFTYILLSSVLFGVEGPTLVAAVLHTLQSFALLIVLFAKMFNKLSKTKFTAILCSFIVLSLLVYLFIMIIADSEYTRTTVADFWERVRLALIYPGDWLNVTVSTGISIVVVPTLYFLLNPLVLKMNKNKYE